MKTIYTVTEGTTKSARYIKLRIYILIYTNGAHKILTKIHVLLPPHSSCDCIGGKITFSHN